MPKKPKHRVLSKSISVRVKESMREKIDFYAENDDLDVSEWVRRIVEKGVETYEAELSKPRKKKAV